MQLKDFEINVLFTKSETWIQCDFTKSDYGVWVDLSLKEIYTPKPEHQKLLGSTDARSIIDVGFMVPNFAIELLSWLK